MHTYAHMQAHAYTCRHMHTYAYPPTSPERRACETRYHQPTYYHLVRHPTAMTASISSSARPSSSRQPSNLGSKATAQAALGDSGLQQPRQDAANLVTYLLIRGHRYLPSGGTGPQTPSPPPPPWAHFGPKNHNKNDAETKSLEGRPKGRKRVARNPIRSCLCSPNTFSHFCKNSKYHRKCAHVGSSFRSFWIPFSRLSPTSGLSAPRPRPKVGTR